MVYDGFNNLIWDQVAGGAGDATLADLASTATGKGSALVGFKQSGTGSVDRTVNRKLLELEVSPEDFGAIGDGTTDDAAAINAAINYVASLGGGKINLGSKTYAVGSTITISNSNVQLIGKGASTYSDGGLGQQAATTIKWIGGAGGIVISCATPQGVSSAMVSDLKVCNIYINCNALAITGIAITSIRYSSFEDIFVENATSICYAITTAPNGTIGEAQDTQRCRFINCKWKCTATTAVRNCHGMRLTSNSPGTSTSNTSINYFEGCSGQTYNGIGFWLIDADNNTFNMCYAQIVTGTGTSLIISGAYSNRFYGWGGTVIIQGPPSGAFQNSISNCFYAVDEANGTAYPVVDAGCTVQWHGTTNGFVNLLGKNVSLSNATGLAATQLPNLGNSTLLIHNSAQSGHIETDGTNSYSWSIDASGNYRLLKAGGIGLLDLTQGSGVTLRTNRIGFQGAAPIAKPTVSGAKGSNAALGSLITALSSYGLITDSTTT